MDCAAGVTLNRWCIRDAAVMVIRLLRSPSQPFSYLRGWML